MVLSLQFLLFFSSCSLAYVFASVIESHPQLCLLCMMWTMCMLSTNTINLRQMNWKIRWRWCKLLHPYLDIKEIAIWEHRATLSRKTSPNIKSKRSNLSISRFSILDNLCKAVNNKCKHLLIIQYKTNTSCSQIKMFTKSANITTCKIKIQATIIWEVLIQCQSKIHSEWAGKTKFMVRNC